MGFEVWGLRFEVWDWWFGVEGMGCEVWVEDSETPSGEKASARGIDGRPVRCTAVRCSELHSFTTLLGSFGFEIWV